MSVGEAKSEPLPWLSATKTRAFRIGDPLLDWLDLYGAGNGFMRDDAREGWDERTDFGRFIMNKGIAFEEALYPHVAELIPGLKILPADRARPVEELTAETLAQMRAGVPAIGQACVSHGPTRTWGFVDLLIRSDVAATLFPLDFGGVDATSSAPAIAMQGQHYVAVDIKYSTLALDRNGDATCSSGSKAVYASQLFVYNRALGEMQGYTPTHAFLIGRSVKHKVAGVEVRTSGALARIGRVPMGMATNRGRGPSLESVTDEAVSWYREVSAKGHSWDLVPVPSRQELYPNMANTSDAPWHVAKKEIARELGELTMLWGVGVATRDAAHTRQPNLRIEDVRSSDAVGIKGAKQSQRLDAILDAQHGADPVQPPFLRKRLDVWAQHSALEFYVDFETVSDVDDDFSTLPTKGGTPLIYMVGCGHIENGAWTFRVFTVDELTPAAEATALDAWHEHMAVVTERLAPGHDPLVFHWSNAERSVLETAYNSACRRHDRTWPELNWFDFLSEVVREEPVAVRGSLGFGLKSVAKAMHKLGLI